MKKTLTIVIPNYNKAKYISRTLDSILRQTHLPNEIIVVDDCSTDNSVEVINKYINKYSFIKLIKLTNNMGVQYARNEGIKKARSKFICCIDSDDIYLRPDVIEKQLSKCNNRSFVGVYTLTIDENDNLLSKKLNFKEKVKVKLFYKYYFYIVEELMAWPYLYIVSKQNLEKIGLYSYKYNFLEDVDIILKLIFNGIKPRWINIEAKGYRVSHDANHLSHAPRYLYNESINFLRHEYYPKLDLLTKIFVNKKNNYYGK